jgi:hypothetical protein
MKPIVDIPANSTNGDVIKAILSNNLNKMVFEKNLCRIKAILETEQRRITAMLKCIDNVETADDLAYTEQGFELSSTYMKMGQRLCQEVMENE